jgi:hypothetical protein
MMLPPYEAMTNPLKFFWTTGSLSISYKETTIGLLQSKVLIDKKKKEPRGLSASTPRHVTNKHLS